MSMLSASSTPLRRGRTDESSAAKSSSGAADGAVTPMMRYPAFSPGEKTDPVGVADARRQEGVHRRHRCVHLRLRVFRLGLPVEGEGEGAAVVLVDDLEKVDSFDCQQAGLDRIGVLVGEVYRGYTGVVDRGTNPRALGLGIQLDRQLRHQENTESDEHRRQEQQPRRLAKKKAQHPSAVSGDDGCSLPLPTGRSGKIALSRGKSLPNLYLVFKGVANFDPSTLEVFLPAYDPDRVSPEAPDNRVPGYEDAFDTVQGQLDEDELTETDTPVAGTAKMMEKRPVA
jgi:hypothetical protein